MLTICIYMGDTLSEGQCVTFLETYGTPQYVGVVLRVKEVLHIKVAEVLWNDGSITVTGANSLRAL